MKNFFPLNQIYKISKKFPTTIAVESSKETFSYENFFQMILNLSKKIILKKEGATVVIIGEKNILSYVSFFSVLRAGGTYIPLSSNLPIERVIKIISLTKAEIIISESKNLTILKRKFPKKDFFSEKDLNSKILKENFKKENLRKINKLAYIIFTSGSTGVPKGVCISRKSLDHYVKWLYTKLKIPIGSRCSQFPEIGFDLSVTDIYGTLCSGGTLCPVDNNYGKIFPGRFIKNKKINFLVCVPSLIDIIRSSKDLNSKNFKLLKRIFFCGEPLLKSHVKDIFKAKKDLEIINAYGPTEATVSCTYKKITPKNLIKNIGQSISIGKTIKGMKIKLLDNKKFSKLKGEILLFGKQLANGYLKKSENKNKFIYSKKDGFYFRTGDYVVVKNKELYFKNRVDSQIKINGHRIELDDITANLKKFGLKNVTTIVFDNKILSFYSDKIKINLQKMKLFLKKKLPEYMMPDYYFYIKKIPYNQNTKLDISNLMKLAKKKINEKK